MQSLTRRARTALGHLWQTSRPLTATGVLMLVVLAGNLAGLWLDGRTIAGAPAWLKPAKFAVSTTIYSLTLTWLLSLLPTWRRTRTLVGWTTAAVFVIEIAIIDLQAWRGTTSHFNVNTRFDAALFAVMGIGIFVQTAASVAVAVGLWRETFENAALAAAVRAGMIITILGAASGGLMTRPTAAQLESARANGRIAVAGAHTVGAPDGGPGLPGVLWSRDHGDLRVGHFVGLHAIQALPILAMLASRRRSREVAARLVRIAASSYGALFVLLVVQALRAESIVSPGTISAVLYTAWMLMTLVAAWAVARPRVALDHPALAEA